MTLWQRFLIWLKPQWRWDKYNPYRRYCRYCDQQQDAYINYASGRVWEDMYPVKPRKPECNVVHPDDQS